MSKNFPYCKACRDYKPIEPGQIHYTADYQCRFYKETNMKSPNRFTALPTEITTHNPHLNRTNNIIIGIAVGVMIMASAVIFVVASFIQNVI
jgi:hypothetical protein